MFYGFRGIQEKLRRFKYLRASFKITIRLNGTSFHYGKLIAAWSPCPVPFSTSGLTARTNNLVSVSSFPHVIVSAGMNEVVELDIPFVYPYNYLDMTNSTTRINQARIFIYVLNSLRLSDVVPPIDVTVFGCMTDVTLCGYSNREPVDNSRNLYGFSTDILPIFDKEHQRRIKDVIDGGSAQVNYMTLNVPHQTDSSSLNPFRLTIGDDATTSQVDSEMVNYLCPDSLSEIASRPALLSSFVMNATDVIGDVIFDTPVHPCSGNFISYVNGDLDFCSPLKFVSFPCRYWSGSLKYKLQIVASAYHSARIQIVYTPQGQAFNATLSDDEAFELTSHIVDIQCDSEIEFEIPWASHYPHLAIDGNDLTTANVNGNLGFRVLNTLTYKDSPIPPIEFNLWISAGSDFKLYSMTAPLNFDLTVPDNTPPADVISGGTAQIADTSRDTKESSPSNLVPFVLGNFVSNPSATQVSSLRDVFKSSAPCFILPETNYFTEDCCRAIPSTSTDLFGTNASGAFLSIAPTPLSDITTAYYDWYNLLFRFRRGSYIYTICSVDLEPTSVVNGLLLATSGTVFKTNFASLSKIDTGTLPQLIRSTVLPSVIATFGSLQPFSIQLPFSSNVKFAITAVNGRFSPSVPTYPSNFEAQAIGLSSQRNSALIYRSAGPDMKFYFQVGAPAIFTKS